MLGHTLTKMIFLSLISKTILMELSKLQRVRQQAAAVLLLFRATWTTREPPRTSAKTSTKLRTGLCLNLKSLKSRNRSLRTLISLSR